MKIEINHDACVGCGACIAIDQENLDYDDQGYAKVINQNITDLTLEAKKSCPVDAIIITKEKNSRN